ncbi:DUF4340 domain-containing protein [bacterium]|jgi:hypothetical protein|nr:DUF4340 domain-containing protein [bacterium]MBT4250778.1 DUF4340 domain-containing protein [bacterium]MBT4598222.1 DUF4340 domain-containing protein [bacterium]MBT6753820.1 DUF4340 domain-containing protein [bacterium]MBT7037467.1 DUF4340 domain-containing protein [bacterium]
MNPKNIKLLAIVFTGLLVIAVFPWLKQKITPTKEIASKFENISVNFSQFSKENTEEISIKQGDQETVLSLRDGVWMVNEKEASQEKIVTLFQEFNLAKVQKQSSKNKANQAKFEVNQEQATILTITSDSKDTVFFIGKSGPSFDSFYARKKEIVNVYLVDGNLKNILSVDEVAWEKVDEVGDVEMNDIPPTLEMP